MTSQLIRKAIEADIPRLQEIRAAVRENILSDSSKVTTDDYIWFIQHGPIWVHESNNTIQGFSASDPRDGTIWALFVDPKEEGNGIGQQLLQRACLSLREAGHLRISLNTQANSRAERFYRADGWQCDGNKANGDVNFIKRFEPL